MSDKSKSIGALPSDLKHKNRMQILNALQDGKPKTTADITAVTGISRPTVMKSIQYFINKGIVITEGKGASTESGGKKPDLYSFVCKKLLLTITIWPNFLNINLCRMDLKKITSVRIEAPIKDELQDVFALIEEKTKALLKEYDYTIEDLYGVSLSTTGTVDYAKGILKYSSNFPKWGSNIPVGLYMKQIFGEKVDLVIENVGKMTGRSELLRSEEEKKCILVLFTSWGISACLIEKGEVLNGGNSLIGEVGHMVIDPNDDELCGCGSYGCAERMLSDTKIRKTVCNDKKHKNSPLHKMPVEEIKLSTIFELATDGDSLAKEISEYLARTFAYLVRNTSLVFDPEIVVFQGNYSHADKHFKKAFTENLKKFCYYPKEGAFTTEYDTTPLEELDLLGALSFLQRRFFQDESLYI